MVKKFNGTTKLWEEVPAPIYESNEQALYNLDRVGGGLNLAVGSLYIDWQQETSGLIQTIMRRATSNNYALTVYLTVWLTRAPTCEFLIIVPPLKSSRMFFFTINSLSFLIAALITTGPRPGTIVRISHALAAPWG